MYRILKREKNLLEGDKRVQIAELIERKSIKVLFYERLIALEECGESAVFFMKTIGGLKASRVSVFLNSQILL